MSNIIQLKSLTIAYKKTYWKTLLCIFIVTYFISATYNTIQAASPTSPSARYEQAKKTLKKLQSDPEKQHLREPWLELSESFLSIYNSFLDWINSPFALYYSALSLEELSTRSKLTEDSNKTLERYKLLITRYPKRTITESALLNIAKIYAEQLKNPIKAKEYLQKLLKQYPNSDKISEATIYIKNLSSEEKEKSSYPSISDTKKALSSPPIEQHASVAEQKNISNKTISQLNYISWETQKDILKIIFTTTETIQWSIVSQASNTNIGSPTRLIVSLHDTTPSPHIKPGLCINENILQKLRIDLSTPSITKILLDFKELKVFKVDTKMDPFRLIVYASATTNSLKNGMKIGQSKCSLLQQTNFTHNLAQQLGLNVKTILIDAGHGGKDSGAIHNGIIESELTLNLSKKLGTILTKQGFTVHYTRKSNTWIALQARSHKAATIKADLMISIHINAHNNPQQNGFETYYLDLTKSKEATRIACIENATSEKTLSELKFLLKDVILKAKNYESRKLAESVQKNVIDHLVQKKYRIHNGGVKSAPFHVLMGPNIPSILIEVGYCSNKSEAKLLTSTDYQTSLMEGIAKGILYYLKNLQAY